MITKHKCSAKTPDMKANADKRQAANKAKIDEYHAMYARRGRNARLAKFVTLDLADLLVRLAANQVASCIEQEYLDSVSALTTARRIREALEETRNEAL